MVRHAGPVRYWFGAVLLSAATAVASQTVLLNAVHWDDAHQRWMDIATYAYTSTKKATYVYEKAAVTATYKEEEVTFAGTLVATGMKPSFAYQMKLNGKPSYWWGADGDDWANEQLGYAGRWWVNKVEHVGGVVVAGWNSNDAEYLQWKAVGFTDGVYDYVFEGYLLFDYFVTDAASAASKPFALDSSFHVLWNTSQRRPTAKDSTPATHTVVATRSSGWYAKNRPTKKVKIYAEWEPGRALPDQYHLPAGSYNVRMLLTEESFHETAPDSGQWATVMGHDAVVFNVTGGMALSPQQ